MRNPVRAATLAAMNRIVSHATVSVLCPDPRSLGSRRSAAPRIPLPLIWSGLVVVKLLRQFALQRCPRNRNPSKCGHWPLLKRNTLSIFTPRITSFYEQLQT
jgi:hypothetical protein